MPNHNRLTTTITLPISENDDPDITCVMCNLRHCELAIEVWGHGRHVWSGIHNRCLTRWREVQPPICEEK